MHQVLKNNYGIIRPQNPFAMQQAMLMQQQRMMLMNPMFYYGQNPMYYPMGDSNLSGMQLVTLEGLDGYTKEETEGINRVEKLFNTNEVPHFSILEDPLIITGLIMNRKTLTLTDKAGNTIFFGYYDDDKRNVQEFNMMFDSGIFFGKTDSNAIQSSGNVYDRVRKTGDQFPINTALDIIKFDRRMIDRMYEVEKKGRSAVPYIYRIKDVDTYGWDSVISILLPALGLVSLVFPAISPILTGLLTNLATTVNKFVRGENVTFKDLISNVADTLSVIGVNDGVLKSITEIGGDAQPYMDSVEKYYLTGSDVYNAIATQKYSLIPGILKVDNSNAINDLQKLLKIDDKKSYSPDSISKAANLPLAEVEKMIQSIENSRLVNQVATQQIALGDEIHRQADALKIPAIQQFLTNNTASIEPIVAKAKNEKSNDLPVFNAYMPNVPAIAKGIMRYNSDGMSLLETKSIIDLAQGKNKFPENLVPLTVDALIEKAKQTTANNEIFVIPSNLPENLQGYLLNKIPAVVPQARVKTLHPKIKFYREFV